MKYSPSLHHLKMIEEIVVKIEGMDKHNACASLYGMT